MKEIVQPLTERVHVHAPHDIRSERVRQHIPRILLPDPPRPQIEHLFFVKLSDGGAMCAFDVVGEDLQLWFRVDGRAVRQQQRLVGLPRIGLLCILPDEDLAVEHTPRRAVQHRLVQLMACTMRMRVVDDGMVVDELLAGSKGESVQRAFGTRRPPNVAVTVFRTRLPPRQWSWRSAHCPCPCRE